MKLEFSKFSDIVNDPHANGNVEKNLTELYKDFKHKLSSKKSISQRRLIFGEFQLFLTQKFNKHPHLPLLNVLLELRLFYPTKFLNDAPAPLSIYQNQMEQLSESHTFILNTLKRRKFESEIIAIISRFFVLEDEMNGSSGPSWHMIDYLTALTKELHKVLLQKNVLNLEMKLFAVLIRYNFNKEEIYQYCIKRMDILLRDKENMKAILDSIEIENLTTVRIDMFYNRNANSLSKDIQGDIDKRRKYISNRENGFQPLQFKEPSGVYLAVIGVLVRLNVLASPDKKEDFYLNLRTVTRGSKNNQYKIVTIKNRLKLKENEYLEKAREIFRNAIILIDKIIEDNLK